MNIFNSLGSNYDLKFALKALFTQDQKNYSDSLKSLLNKHYSGETDLFYKGREAIRAALSNLPKKSIVAICGFTCWAVYDAILKAGHKVEYLDIPKGDLNFSPLELQRIAKKTHVVAVIVQNTLGFPCEISQIAKLCREKGSILIEDLAHSAGARYKDGEETGKIGDLVILSFSQDKVVDGVSGGALITRNKKLQKRPAFSYQPPDKGKQYKDRLYPLLTYLIRGTYSAGIGKTLHYFLKKLNLLSKPFENNSLEAFHELPGWYCRQIESEFKKLDSNLKHRAEIAAVYAKNLNPKIISGQLDRKIANSSNLRFPIFVKNRNSLIQHLAKGGIFVSDIWYDAPIAPKKYLKLTDYKSQCPNSEATAEEIVNLPTHRNISTHEAEIICQRINQWLKSR